METLDQKPVIILSADGQPISMGRFELTPPALPGSAPRLELVFETPAMACRLRIDGQKIPAIKKSWNGDAFRYVLLAGNEVWQDRE